MDLLLIECTTGDCTSVSELLTQVPDNNWSLHTAASPLQGMELLKTHNISAVLYGSDLTDTQSKADFRHLLHTFPTIPVLILASEEDAPTTLWSIEHGAEDYLMKKDLTPSSLDLHIRIVIERKRIENDRIGHMRFMDALIDALPDTVFVKDAENLNYVRINKAGETLLGVPREALIGKNDFALFPQVRAELFTRKDREVLERKQLMEITEESIETKHKGIRTLRTRKAPILNAEGEPVYLLGHSEDITEKKDLEKAKQWLVALVEQSVDAIVSTDLEGNIQSWNKGAELLLGYSLEEAIGRSVQIYVPEFKLDEHIEIKNRVASGETLPPFETQRRHKDGALIDVLLSLSPIKDEEGRTLGISAILRDITEKKISYQRLQEAYDELKNTHSELVQMEKLAVIGQFSAGIAHELKNPIAILLQGLYFLENKANSDQSERADVFGMMKESVRRSEKIINRLLMIGRPSDLDLKPVDPKVILQQALDLTVSSLPLNNIVAKIEAYEAQSVPYIDEGLMQEALINLMTNAVQAMPEGGALTLRYGLAPDPLWERMRTSFKTVDVKNISGCFVFEVADNGSGIEPEAMDKLFTPFYTTKPKNIGTGLGLPLVQSIVQKHGGVMDVESRLGEGSCMRLCLPLSAAQMSAASS